MSAGININSGNIEIYDSEVVNVSWINNNFNGTNRVIFRNSSYTFYDQLINDNFVELNLSSDFNEDLYFLSVYSEDMKLSSMITISKYISPVTLSGDTTLTTTQVVI